MSKKLNLLSLFRSLFDERNVSKGGGKNNSYIEIYLKISKQCEEIIKDFISKQTRLWQSSINVMYVCHRQQTWSFFGNFFSANSAQGGYEGDIVVLHKKGVIAKD